MYAKILEMDVNPKYENSFKEKRLTENEWYEITSYIKYLQDYRLRINSILTGIIILIILIVFIYNLINYFLINPLLPLWNSSSDQTKATLIFGSIFGIATTVLTHILRSVIEGFKHRSK